MVVITIKREQIASIDPFILLSWINTKLRDEFSSFSSLCEDYNLAQKDVVQRLEAIGYLYKKETNQFISIDA